MIADPITLRVYGEPVPQGSKRAFKVRGSDRSVVVDVNERPLKSWRDAIGNRAMDWIGTAGRMPLDEPVAVVATFWLTRPKSLPRWRWLPWTKPDLDKLARAVLDGISSIVIRDDARVVDLVVRKRFATSEPPGVSILVVPLGEDERAEFSPSLSLLTSVIADLYERAEAVAR